MIRCQLCGTHYDNLHSCSGMASHSNLPGQVWPWPSPALVGWKCPQCQQINSPFVQSCPNCKPPFAPNIMGGGAAGGPGTLVGSVGGPGTVPGGGT